MRRVPSARRWRCPAIGPVSSLCAHVRMSAYVRTYVPACVRTLRATALITHVRASVFRPPLRHICFSELAPFAEHTYVRRMIGFHLEDMAELAFPCTCGRTDRTAAIGSRFGGSRSPPCERHTARCLPLNGSTATRPAPQVRRAAWCRCGTSWPCRTHP